MTNPTKTRRVRPSQARWGTSACAHDPKTASPEAKSPPKTTRATSETAAVRTTGQTTLIRLVTARVRPSRGSPRTAARGQDASPARSGEQPLRVGERRRQHHDSEHDGDDRQPLGGPQHGE